MSSPVLADRAGPSAAQTWPSRRSSPTGSRAWAAALVGALGLALVAAAFELERMGRGQSWADPLFWGGLAAIVLPVAWGLVASATPRSDRVLLVALTAFLTYAVKVLHDPLMFTFGDEFAHLSETQRVLQSEHLFAQVPLSGISVAAGYPGLHAVTAAISQVTGLGVFASGLVVVGTARLVLMLALFLLFERISGSSRIAGVGALLYAGSANFLFWSAQFSYESLSLPLFVVAMLMVVSRPADDRGSRRACTAAAALLTLAVVATHHVSSYALVGCLWLLTILAVRRRWRGSGALGLAIFATACAAGWFFVAADGTGSYLGYVFRRTVDAVAQVSQRGARVPFQSTSGLATPVSERLVGTAAAGLVCLGVLVALRRLWRDRTSLSAPAALLAAAAAGFLALFPLKAFPGAWETANRSADFLFIGVAFLLAGLVCDVATRARWPRGARAVIVGLCLLLICGGVIQGWPSRLRLPQPLEVKVGNAVIRPQGLAMSDWAVQHLPTASVYAADESSGRELAVAGARFVLGGGGEGMPQLLESSTLPPWQRDVLVGNNVDYLVADRRRISSDNIAGYAFQSDPHPDGHLGYYSSGVRRKFERIPRSQRVWDSGDIVLYDVRGMRSPVPACDRVLLRLPAQAFTCTTHRKVVTLAGADGVARLPSERVEILETVITRRPVGIDVSVRVLVKNTGGRGYAPDPDQRHFRLAVGRTFYRWRHVPYRTDDFAGTPVLRPYGQRQGSVSFSLGGPGAEQFLRAGGALRMEVPAAAGVHGPPRVGVISIKPPRRAAP